MPEEEGSPTDDGPSIEHEPTALGPGEPRSFGGGRYVVRRRLGAGNFATVYLAFDERLDVPVAVKLLSDRWSWEPEVRGRFVQEARILRSLNDRNVVQIRDIAETEDGHPYLVMDYATRGTVEQRMVALAQRGVRPDARQLRRFAAALADALAVLHSRRIAHRDIKPSNLLITGDGEVEEDGGDPVLLRPDEQLVLGDLGLAKDLRLASGITVGVGTAGYMAPEQASAGAKIDTRTDIYAASAVLAQAASGEPPDPLRRTSDGVLTSGEPLPISIPASLAAPILRGLDSDPDHRTQTIGEWQADVDTALVALDDGGPAGPTAPPRGHRWAVIGAGAVAIVGLGVTGALVLAGGGGDGEGATSTTVAAVAATSTTGATTTSVAASTTTEATSTTVARTTAVAPSSTVAPAGSLAVTLSGPSTLGLGEQGFWGVDAPGATGGTWSWDGPFTLLNTDWLPGDAFQAMLNVPGTITLTLDVFDAAGQTGRGSITFTVE